jgi:iron complex outermembrane receptor protein
LTPDYPGAITTLTPANESFDNWSRFRFITDSVSTIHELRLLSPTEDRLFYSVGLFYFKEDQSTFLGSTGDRGGFFQGSEFNQPNTNAESYSVYGDMTFSLTETTRISAGLRYTYDEKERVGVNARYGFALGAFDTTTGDEFGCCLGARIGTEGFEFAAFDREIYDPDIDGSGEVSEQEFIDFYLDGIKSFGDNDNLDDILAGGVQGGGSPNLPDCLDPQVTDGLICNQDGKLSFVGAINANTSITPQKGDMNDEFVDWRLRIAHDLSDVSMAYFLIATGHKSGGFNDTFKDPELGIDIAPTYDTEKVTMYEFGWKNEFDLGDVPTQLNASAFYYDYTDQVFTSILSVEQALEFSSGSTLPPSEDSVGALVVSFSFNAADSEIYGVQLDGLFQFPKNINLKWTALWLEATIQDAEDIQDSRFQADVAPDDAVFRSISGKRLPRTPEFQLNLSLSQFFDTSTGSFDYVVSAGWRDDQFLTIYNSEDYGQPDNPRQRLDDTVDAYWSMDAGIGYSHGDGRLRFELFGNNLTGDVHTAATIITQFDNTRFFTRPKTYGFRMKYRF